LSSGKDTLCQKIGESVLLEFAMNTEAEILMRASADIDKLVTKCMMSPCQKFLVSLVRFL